jgi:hypothetical protein
MLLAVYLITIEIEHYPGENVTMSDYVASWHPFLGPLPQLWGLYSPILYFSISINCPALLTLVCEVHFSALQDKTPVSNLPFH